MQAPITAALTDAHHMVRDTLLSQLKQHRSFDDIEADHLARTIAFVERHDNCCDRQLTEGHITASSWIIDESASYALLTHHRKLDRWLQLGGHVEDDSDILEAALREAREESGLSDIHTVVNDIFDVDVHPIPARKSEPAHFHYDVRFLFQADRGDTLTISDESHDLRWFSIAELQAMPADDSIDRMVAKMLARK